ncbi:glutamate--tRNA ligase, partial [Candidatus Micrarchaeota archaeon]|nr:glutamate--tRNA ligase [Candidatus Micrarchaeota archaeon]
MALEKIVRKHALKNAFDYGKANPGGVVGKVIADFPDAKADMKKTMALIAKTIAEVNKLSKQEVEAELGNYEFALKKKEERHFRLEGAQEGKVVTRIAPEPSAYPHIGHAKAFFLNEAAAKEYGGRLAYLKFDDTNPENESQEFVDAFKNDVDWLGIKYEKIVFASDYMKTYYELAEKLIKQKDAYVCSCSQEKISKMRGERKHCKCFDNSVEENLSGFKSMQAKAEPESITLRLVGDMESNNTTLLDPVIFRVITSPHYRQGTKYRCWPVYDFDSPITDSILGITHMMRSKEYELRDELYLLIL